MRVLVTGANGFVGRAVCAELTLRGHAVVAAIRTAEKAAGLSCVRAAVVGDLGPDTDWREALNGIDAVVHLAARVHVMGESGEAAEAAHRRANTEGTRRLAEAAAAGARRFVFLSTVKVMGESSEGRAPFTESDTPAPDADDAYGQSKLAAEIALAGVARTTGLEVAVLRPPLVYGPGVRANF
ncbi:MAG: NAD-dependent epimerase/dehydratase family protein, partial [Alphaproteobacteria bacterium]|nr:NAD-dependent epimerase/dehydratase family protein [Alphaproteobacteria bacterium]